MDARRIGRICNMKGIVLAAGIGERMRPLTLDTPKPMLAINGKPLLQYTLGVLRASEITQIGVTTFYLKEKITNFFRDGRRFGVDLTYLDESELIPSGLALRQMVGFVDDATVVINGDNLTDMDFRQATSTHRERGLDATIVAYSKGDDLSPDSQIFFDENFRVTRFYEKMSSPERANIPLERRFTNTGMYVFNRSAIEAIPEDTTQDLGKLIPYLLDRGLKIGVQFVGPKTYYQEVGNMERFLRAKKQIESGEVSLGIPLEEVQQLISTAVIPVDQRLEIGSGGKPTPGYLHQDVTRLPGVNLDFVCNPWEVPLSDGSLSDIIALGVMEHLRYEDVGKTLRHFNRLLKIGGSFRFDVPDMRIWAEHLYNMTHNKSHKNPLRDEHVWATMYGWQRWPGDEHKSGWTRDSIVRATNESGLKVAAEGPSIFTSDGIYRGRFTRYGDAHVYIKAVK
jgi:NDP-sugar pyrophosphorylase family protein/predicted SAM-dependent methyltransferase